MDDLWEDQPPYLPEGFEVRAAASMNELAPSALVQSGRASCQPYRYKRVAEESTFTRAIRLAEIADGQFEELVRTLTGLHFELSKKDLPSTVNMRSVYLLGTDIQDRRQRLAKLKNSLAQIR